MIHNYCVTVSVLESQVKVAKSAMRQALTWNEDDDMGIGKSKALRIVVIEGAQCKFFCHNKFDEGSTNNLFINMPYMVPSGDVSYF